jgi:hypothetical protein
MTTFAGYNGCHNCYTIAMIEREKPSEANNEQPENKYIGRSRGISRRKLISYVGKGAGVVGAGAVLYGEYRGWRISDIVKLGDHSTFDHPATRLVSPHTASSRQNTHVVEIGDSLAAGYWDTSHPNHGAAQIVVEREQAQEKDWKLTSLAVNHSHIDAASKQLDRLPDVTTGDKNIDVFLSTGPNNLVAGLESMQGDIEELKEHPASLLWSNIDRRIARLRDDTLNELDTTVLDKIAFFKSEERMPINRVVYIGIPNLSKTNFSIDYVHGGGRLSYSYHDKPDPFVQTLIERLGYRTNEVFADRLLEFKERSGIDVLYLNTFNLADGDLQGIHPQESGQQALADEYMRKTLLM